MPITNPVKPEPTPASPAPSFAQAQHTSATSPVNQPTPTILPDRPPTILPSRGEPKTAASTACVERIAENHKDNPLALAGEKHSP